MRSAMLLAPCGLAVVFAFALLFPWEPNDGGGVAVYLIAAFGSVLAFGSGFLAARNVLAGAFVGFAAVCLYFTAVYIDNELGWRGASWSDYGDSGDPSLLTLPLAWAIYGIPAALLGAVLGWAGGVARHLGKDGAPNVGR